MMGEKAESHQPVSRKEIPITSQKHDSTEFGPQAHQPKLGAKKKVVISEEQQEYKSKRSTVDANFILGQMIETIEFNKRRNQ